jgi:hypothetical protein
MTAADHIEDIHEQGWTKIETAPGEWVALVPNVDNSAYGGTLWKRAADGNDYAEGATEGFPVSAALSHDAAGRAVAVLIKKELGA